MQQISLDNNHAAAWMVFPSGTPRPLRCDRAMDAGELRIIAAQ
jgi:hypothetical protein